ncbi:hypothetical protein [Deferribacter abyssi]|uniref:hypothetical protein n=1 Tax=Deferribacter abyssi TaxID=213806 RepID=UPI003C26E825
MIEYQVNIFKNIEQLMNEFEHVKEKMKQLVDSQKKYYVEKHIYLDLKYCGKDGCKFCPHNFIWIISYRDSKTGKLKKYELGRKITHKILIKYNKNFLYPKLKELEKKANVIQAERDIIAKTLDRINKILNRYNQYKRSIESNY